MWSGMVNVGDGGGEDRYIRLRSHNISHRLKAFSGNSFFFNLRTSHGKKTETFFSLLEFAKAGGIYSIEVLFPLYSKISKEQRKRGGKSEQSDKPDKQKVKPNF